MEMAFIFGERVKLKKKQAFINPPSETYSVVMHGKQNNCWGGLSAQRERQFRSNKWKIATLSLVGILLVLFFVPLGKADLSLGNYVIELILQNGQTQNPFTIMNATGSTLLKIDANSTLTINDANGNPSTVMGPRSGVEGASYIIFTDGTNVYAKNGTTGKVEFSGSDAATVIQNSVNSLANGGIILIKDGIYIINSTISVLNNITLSGGGFGTTLKSNFGGAANAVINMGSIGVGRNSVVQDLRIDGNKLSSTQGDGIRVYGIEFMIIRNVKIDNVANYGIRFPSGASRTLVENVIINGTGLYSISLEDGNSTIIKDSILTGGQIGINLGSRDAVISNNIIRNTTQAGVYTSSTAIDGLISGNKIMYTGTDGISLYNAALMSVVGNSISYTSGDSIIVNGGNNITITGNTITSPTNAPIVITGNSSRVSIVGNIAKSSGNHGISLADSKYVSIIGNEVFDSAQNGISFNNVNDSAISANIVTNNGKGLIPSNRDGIQLWNSYYDLVIGNSVVDDQVSPTQLNGVRETGSSDYNLISNNALRGSSTSQITKLGANTKVISNMGYVTENKNSTSVSNAGAIVHGLAATPTFWTVFPQAVNVTASATANSTHLNINLVYINGTAVTNAINVTWQAEV